MIAVVLGGAASVFPDLARVEHYDVVVATNDAGYTHTGRVDHWVTLHAEKLGGWIEERRKRGGNLDFESWGRDHSRTGHPERNLMVDHTLTPWGHGSSGMLAVQVAVDELKADKTILCGVPMDASSHFFDTGGWKHWCNHRHAWDENLGRMKGKVFSMGGYTQELLGAP